MTKEVNLGRVSYMTTQLYRPGEGDVELRTLYVYLQDEDVPFKIHLFADPGDLKALELPQTWWEPQDLEITEER